MPRRGRIGTRLRPFPRKILFTQQFGQRRDREHLRRRRIGAGEQEIPFALDQAGIEVGAGKRRAGDEARQEIDVVVDADDAIVGQRLLHPRQRAVAVVVPDDQFRDHRIVEGRDGIAFLDAGVDAHVEAFGRRRQMHELAGRGQEVLGRVLGVDARFQRMAVDAQLLLHQRQLLAGGDAQLPFDEIEAGDHLGDGMLDLQARVHLHEEELAVLRGDEFDRAGADIADRLGGRHRRLAHLAATLRRHARRRRFFQHLLVAALHRAVALEQVDALAELIAEHLDFDMARTDDVFLDQHVIGAEARRRLALAGCERGVEILRLHHLPHALAAAAGRRLDHDGITDPVGLRLQPRRILVVAVIAGRQRHAGGFHQLLGFRLRTHGANGADRRADEDDARLVAGVAEGFVLGQEAVSGMDRLRAGALRGGDDLVDHQIAFARRRRADEHGFVGHAHVAAHGVGFGIDRDGGDAHAARRLDDAAGDFAAIGDEDLVEHGVSWFPLPFSPLAGRRWNEVGNCRLRQTRTQSGNSRFARPDEGRRDTRVNSPVPSPCPLPARAGRGRELTS